MKKLHEYGDFEYIKRKKTKLRRKEKRKKKLYLDHAAKLNLITIE